ncbi:MAG: hypothetical protein JWM73_834, partial [Solirubrobacterales bacterium]|nr:hypothetical protein [Solirubrobacterales bacterium]
GPIGSAGDSLSVSRRLGPFVQRAVVAVAAPVRATVERVAAAAQPVPVAGAVVEDVAAAATRIVDALG